uniref:TROVE domain-containing protein n=1 Tax=Globodera pallida TaxID=36090 RepID=A0A183CFI6_GLOPA
MRKCVSEWYLQRSPKELAVLMTKYRNRVGYTHRDLLRLAHPMACRNNNSRPFWPNEQTLVYDQLFKYACSGIFDAEKGNLPSSDGGEIPLLKKARCDYTLDERMVQTASESNALKFIEAVMEASKLKNGEPGEQRCVELIREFGLVREHIPTDLLNSAPVWAELLEHMPMTALIRNLSKLSSICLIDGERPENEKYVDLVVSKILDQSAVHRARIHPISVLLAASVYEAGRGVKGSLTWKVNERVKKALDDCFTLAFHNVEPTKHRFCLALDVSGSMSCPITGGVLSCRNASAAMASVILRTEENVDCVAFQQSLTSLPFSRESTITEMVNFVSEMDFGSTDCALPMIWAAEQQREFDAFVVFTDSETWAGNVQPFEALVNYRNKMGIPNAKLAVMGMASTEFTIADPNDPGMLDIVGLDSAVPELLRSFVLDEI